MENVSAGRSMSEPTARKDSKECTANTGADPLLSAAVHTRDCLRRPRSTPTQEFWQPWGWFVFDVFKFAPRYGLITDVDSLRNSEMIFWASSHLTRDLVI